MQRDIWVAQVAAMLLQQMLGNAELVKAYLGSTPVGEGFLDVLRTEAVRQAKEIIPENVTYIPTPGQQGYAPGGGVPPGMYPNGSPQYPQGMGGPPPGYRPQGGPPPGGFPPGMPPSYTPPPQGTRSAPPSGRSTGGPPGAVDAQVVKEDNKK